MNTNLELADEGVYLNQRVLWDLVLQSGQGGMNILEAAMELALHFGKAKRGINNEKDRAEELANRFEMLSNNFLPNSFDRAVVPKRARRLGSAWDHGRVVSKNSRSFSLATSGVIRAWSWL